MHRDLFRCRFLIICPLDLYYDDKLAAHVRIGAVGVAFMLGDHLEPFQLDVFSQRLNHEIPILIDCDRWIFEVWLLNEIGERFWFCI